MTWQEYLEYEKEDARKESYEAGERHGMQQGLQQGMQQGMIRGTIATLQEMNVENDEIKQKIMEKYGLSEDKVQEYLSGNL